MQAAEHPRRLRQPVPVEAGEGRGQAGPPARPARRDRGAAGYRRDRHRGLLLRDANFSTLRFQRLLGRGRDERRGDQQDRVFQEQGPQARFGGHLSAHRGGMAGDHRTQDLRGDHRGRAGGVFGPAVAAFGDGRVRHAGRGLVERRRRRLPAPGFHP